MSLYVYCPRRSNGAFELVKALDGYRLRRFDGIDFWDKRRRFGLKDGDVIVCWGAFLPEIEGIRVLNAVDKPFSRFNELEKLANANVPIGGITRGKLTGTTLEPRLQTVLKAADPSYCIQREVFTSEYRIHSFDKRSIRAGIKVPREGFIICLESEWKPEAGLAHPWVRSYLGGWRVAYDGFKSTPQLRSLAHKAVAALGLTFGAVDIGQRPDGGLKVLEVDRAPRIEGATVASYARAITRWVKEGADVSQGVNDDGGGVPVGVPADPDPEPDSEPDFEPDYDPDDDL